MKENASQYLNIKICAHFIQKNGTVIRVIMGYSFTHSVAGRGRTTTNLAFKRNAYKLKLLVFYALTVLFFPSDFAYLCLIFNKNALLPHQRKITGR